MYEQLDSASRREQQRNCVKILSIIDIGLVCTCQGILLRGHSDMGHLRLDQPVENDGNFERSYA